MREMSPPLQVGSARTRPLDFRIEIVTVKSQFVVTSVLEGAVMRFPIASCWKQLKGNNRN